MKKLYKIVATKTIPLIILTEEDYDKNPNWELIECWVREEEKNMHTKGVNGFDAYDMEIFPMEHNEKLKYPFYDWNGGCNVYHEGDEDFTLSDARIIASLSEIVDAISKKNSVPLSEAKEKLIDSIHKILVE